MLTLEAMEEFLMVESSIHAVCQQLLNLKTLNIPEERELPHSDIASSYVVVADDAFALKRYLMKPYASRNLTVMQRVYNCRLSRARRVVENAFCAAVFVFSARLYRWHQTKLRALSWQFALSTISCCETLLVRLSIFLKNVNQRMNCSALASKAATDRQMQL